MLVIVSLSVLIVSLHVWTYTKVSPIDEFSHIDVLARASRLELVEVGERVGETAMREEACRRLDRPDPIPSCDTPTLSPQSFQERGESTAASKFPVYHFVTGIPARFMTTVLPDVSSIVTTARLFGGLWLGAALFMTWLVMRELGVGRWAAVSSLAILGSTPVVLHASSIVNADATLLLGGSALLWAVLRWERRSLAAWVPLAIAVVALLTELTNLLGVAVVAAYLAARALRREREMPPDGVDASSATASAVFPYRTTRQLVIGAATLAALATAAVWAFPRLHQAVIGAAPPPAATDPPAAEVLALRHVPEEIRVGPVEPNQIAGEVGALVTPVRRPFVPSFLAGAVTTVLIAVTDWLLLGAAVGAALRSEGGSRIEALAVAALLVMILGGPALALDNARRDVFFAIPPRFGLPLLPALAALLAGSLTKRWTLFACASWAMFSVVWVFSRFLS